MIKLTPNDDNVIVKIIEQESKLGILVVPDKLTEESTLAEVMVPAQESYYRDGTLRPQVRYKSGDRVRIPKGRLGTGVPEAPEGEKWLAIAEDDIVYKIEDF